MIGTGLDGLDGLGWEFTDATSLAAPDMVRASDKPTPTAIIIIKSIFTADLHHFVITQQIYSGCPGKILSMQKTHPGQCNEMDR